MSQTGRAPLPFWLAGVVGYGYVLAVPLEPYPAHPVVKAVPLLVLSLTALRRLAGPLRYPMAAAFLAAAIGDLLLGIDRSAYLRPALFSFLVTQVLYAWVFWRYRGASGAGRRLASLEMLALLGFYALVLPAAPREMIIPVLVYSLALVAMATGAAMSAIGRLLPIGGALFFVADSLIAVNQFVWDFPFSTQVIVTLYISAQLMIAWSVLSWGSQDSPS